MGFGFAHHYVHATWKKLIWPSVASFLSAALMGLGVYLHPHLYWLALGPLVYVAGLWLFRALDREEWERVAHVLRLKK
jgi:O-antigen/teichoic acid export membrane protein